MTFLFPVFLTILFFQHNRTIYDVIANSTVVVTGSPQPRQAQDRLQWQGCYSFAQNNLLEYIVIPCVFKYSPKFLYIVFAHMQTQKRTMNFNERDIE